jgi:ectoine hydroxylase-related dioxygenase (phytanoyl-CoA dioxygenase family)
MPISEQDKKQFREEGYILMPEAIPQAQVEELRAVCDHYIAEFDNSEPVAEAEQELMHDGEVLTRVAPDGRRFLANALTAKGNRYFLQQHHDENATLRDFIAGPLMEEICRATLGDNVYFHFEGFVCKAPKTGAKFAWHQDTAYVPKHQGTDVTIWCALDRVDEDNGTVFILPFSHEGSSRELVPHDRLPNGERVGHVGDAPGIPVAVEPGGLAAFNPLMFHRSGPNISDRWRRALVVQFSQEPILTEDGAKPWHSADPFIRDGRRVDVT